MPKPTVAVSTDHGQLRISYRNNGRKYFYPGLKDSKSNKVLAEEIRALVELDLNAGTLDESLVKYKFHKTLGKRLIELSPSEMFDQWLKEKALDVDDVTLKWYHRITNDLAACYGNARAVDITGNKCRNFIKLCEAKGNSPYTLKRKLYALSGCWQWLIENHYLSFNPWLPFPAKIKVAPLGLPNPFTLEEIEAILIAFENHPLYSSLHGFIEFLFFTGCRVGEAIGLRWGSVTHDHTVTIREQLTRGVRKSTKNQKVRVFKASTRIIKVLLTQWDMTGGDDPNTLVFQWNGNPINLNNFRRRVWDIILTELGIPKRKLYNTRATFVSHCLQQGMPPIAIAQITGHSPTTMLKHYAGYLAPMPQLPTIESEV